MVSFPRDHSGRHARLKLITATVTGRSSVFSSILLQVDCTP
jgi:hypothetical protein